MNLALALLPLVVAMALVVLMAVGVYRLLRHWVHPLRILTIGLSHAFYLLVLALVISLGGVLAIIWWALVAGTLLGVVVASIRALRRDPPGSARAEAPSVAAHPAAVPEAGPDGTSRSGTDAQPSADPGAHSAPGPSRRERARRRLSTPPALSEVAVTAVLTLALIAAELVAG